MLVQSVLNIQIQMSTEPTLSSFYLPIKNEVKHLSSIIGILDKLELDRNLELMGIAFTSVIKSEVEYATNGSLNRTSQNKRESAFT